MNTNDFSAQIAIFKKENAEIVQERFASACLFELLGTGGAAGIKPKICTSAGVAVFRPRRRER